MKTIAPFVYFLLLASCASAKPDSYTGSTPAGPVVKAFFGIPLTDSIDFIRWQLSIEGGRYKLACNYGMSKPNTNGFINGGTKLLLEGDCRQDQHYYQLQNGGKVLHIAALNTDLLHLLDADKQLLAGNGGWSYTLNSTRPGGSNVVNLEATPLHFTDSIQFTGRTGCKVPGVKEPGSQCYKLKWSINFYTSGPANQSGRFSIPGSPWHSTGGKTGSWQLTTGKGGHPVYRLDYDNGQKALYLLPLDANVLVFTDAQGQLLVGDEDFSYTLNRK